MDNSKAWYESSGVWGGVVVLVTTVLQTAQLITMEEANIIIKDAPNALTNLAVSLGAILSIYGRVRATKVIGPKPSTSNRPPAAG